MLPFSAPEFLIFLNKLIYFNSLNFYFIFKTNLNKKK
jgi:hypothetical protein